MLVTGIAELVTNEETIEDPDGLGRVHDAAVVVQDGRIEWVGRAARAPAADWAVDLDGQTVVPGFVDSHSHLVFAGDRSGEFVARMAGQRYDGGGIASTMSATAEADDDTLTALVQARVTEMGAQGTTTVEIKSGYGLSVEQEARALRIAGQVTEEVTFLGAHVVPPDHREGTGGRTRAAYVDLVTGEMLRACAPLARWIDVFCEPASPHAFDGEEARTVLEAGRGAGLGLRVHGNQLDHGPGVALAVELGAASVDHCTYLSDADVDALAGAAATTVATLLPGVEFATRSPYPDARRLLDAGVSLALASDYNPGTCGSSSMPLVIALAVREMGMTPAEALRAATVGGARALRRDDVGRVRVGGPAHLAVVDAPTYVHLASRPGVPLTRPLHL